MEMEKDKRDRSIELLVKRISKKIPNSIRDIKKDLNIWRVENLRFCEGIVVNLRSLNRNHIFLEYFKEKYPGVISCVFQEDYVREKRRNIDEKIESLPVSKFEEVYRTFNLSVEDLHDVPEERFDDEKVTAYITGARTEFNDFKDRDFTREL